MERIILGIFLVICVLYDHRNQKIPNGLCSAGVFAGCLFQYYLSGLEGVIEGALYAGAIVAVLLPLWIWRVLGGGDVKLMMVCGFYVKGEIFVLLLFAACCTAFLSLMLMLVRQNFVERMKFFAEYIRVCVIDGTVRRYPFDRKNGQDCDSAGVLVSYGIAVGYFLWVLTGIVG